MGESWLGWQFVIRLDLLFISSALGPALAGAEPYLCCALTGREPSNTCHFYRSSRISGDDDNVCERIFTCVCLYETGDNRLYSTLCVLSICMCILHMSSVQSVNMYCPYVNCFVCFVCLEHAHKNFTHQGTCAAVMWQYKQSVEQANYVYVELIFPIGTFFFFIKSGGFWSVVHASDLFHRRLALHYVVRIENTLVMMIHGITSCSFLLSFSFVLLQRRKIKKTFACFFSRCSSIFFSCTKFPTSTPGGILFGRSSVVTNCSERQFCNVQPKKCFFDSHLRLYT